MTQLMKSDILGIGTSVPERVLTNFDLEKMIDTNDEWIRTRTGIRERRIIDDDENASDLAARAARAAVADAGLSMEELDLVLVATGSPEMVWPATACLVQEKLGIKGCPAFDIQAACAGFVYGLAVADSFVASGLYRRILFIGTEAMTRFLDWTDRGTCILFGDGAGAVVLGPAEESYGLLAHYLAADGSGADMLKIPAGGLAVSGERGAQTIQMRGNEVYKFAVKKLPAAVAGALEQAGMTVADVDYCVPHQANKRIIDAAVERLGLSREKVVGNLEQYGNTSTASIPLALEKLVRSGNLKRGDIVVTAAVGAGLTWGANVIRWSGAAGGTG